MDQVILLGDRGIIVNNLPKKRNFAPSRILTYDLLIANQRSTR